MYRVGVFISHSWTYTDHYKTLSSWIFGQSWSLNGTPISFVDFSIPEENPIHNAPNESTLRMEIYNEIAKSDVIVCPTGMYSNYSKWIEKELAGAESMGKPILAVNPWAQERKSSVVQDRASRIVGWTKQGVINGVWNLFRGLQ